MTSPASIVEGYVSAECVVCGTTFSAPRYRVARGHGKTCSRSCGAKKGGAAFAASRPVATDADIIAYLWENVRVGSADECWPWMRSASVNGRGVVSFRGFRALAPRVAYRSKSGEWPPSDRFVCHTCDNPACCNPEHLWLGTAADNVADMWSKGRARVTPVAGWQRELTHCQRGHEFTPANIVKNGKNGGRVCRACDRLRGRARSAGVTIDAYIEEHGHAV